MQRRIKLISIILISTIITNILLSIILKSKTYAVTQSVSTDISNINETKYPGIKSLIQNLQKEHPNWKFKILYTGLDWNEVIANEYTGHGTSPKNLIYKSTTYQGEWICSICGDKGYDNGNWKCASEQAIRYIMDPRNSINSSDIFQFEELTYTECSISTLQSITAGTFLAGHEQGILDAAKNNNINAYYIFTRLIQEQGRAGTVLTKGEGYNGQNAGYYNAFNIAASGNSTAEILTNALAYAKKSGWDSLDKSINGGIQFLAKQYIKKGQNTLYLQKFDVEATNGLYSNQYMQNVLASQSEGSILKNAYSNMNVISEAHTFLIPVYENMPSQASARPDSNKTSVTNVDYVKINANPGLNLRNSPNGSKIIGSLTYGEIVTRLEKATSKINGTYWDKIQKSNGTVGYVARETYESESQYKLYLVPINETNNQTSSNTQNTNNATTTEKNIKNTSKVKINEEQKIIKVTPDAIAKDILEANGGAIKITRANKDFLTGEAESLATGYIVDDKYTVIKMGDCNGDGKVDTADLLTVQKQLLNISKISDTYYIKAADLNYDNKIDTADLLTVQKKLLNISNIEI